MNACFRLVLGCSAFALLLCLALPGARAAEQAAPKNVILMIGDGMGFEHVRAASFFGYGEEGKLSFEQLPAHKVDTFSADNKITDSAAAATALATGFRVNNGVISRAIPGDKRDLPTLLEGARGKGMRTGVITTTSLVDATPMGFAGHADKRSAAEPLARAMLKNKPNVVFGGGYKLFDRETLTGLGYVLATNAAELDALPADATHAFGNFGNGHMPKELDGLGDLPRLPQMVDKGLRLLEHSPDGFFLMIEGGLIDKVAHGNDLARNVRETLAFAEAAEKVLAWAKARGDTLVVVTADHETGGLRIIQAKAKGELPEVAWASKGHTGVKVPLYATGPGAEELYQTKHHIDVSRTLARLMGVPVEETVEEAEVPAEANPVGAVAVD